MILYQVLILNQARGNQQKYHFPLKYLEENKMASPLLVNPAEGNKRYQTSNKKAGVGLSFRNNQGQEVSRSDAKNPEDNIFQSILKVKTNSKKSLIPDLGILLTCSAILSSKDMIILNH